jgi:hypothetical protein
MAARQKTAQTAMSSKANAGIQTGHGVFTKVAVEIPQFYPGVVPRI